MKPLRESDILKTITDGLAAMKVWHIRMNSGAMFGSHNGRRWAVRFGRKGCADILMIQPGLYNGGRGAKWLDLREQTVTWIECKKPGQKQTPDQIVFQKEVEAEGHRYLVARSWEDVQEALKS